MSLNTNRSGLTQLQGFTNSYTTSPVNVGASWRQISIGNQFALGIKSNNLLYGWGRNDVGQLGDSTVQNRSIPSQVGNLSWSSVSAGASHALAIRSDNLMFGWGLNSNLQTGASSTIASYTGFWKQISARVNTTIALRTDNTLWGWGTNATGQIGDGTVISRSSPVQIGNSFWSTVSIAGTATAGITIDGRLFAWGNNTNGAIGDNTIVNKSSPVQILAGRSFKTVLGNYSSANGEYFLALDSTNKLWAWGFNTSGQFGDGTSLTRSSPAVVSVDKTWRTIAVGPRFAAGIDDSFRLWAWGFNSSGQLGDGTTVSRSSPVQVGIGISFVNIGTGVDSLYALATDGQLYATGLNSNGQLGDNTTVNKSALFPIGTFDTSTILPCLDVPSYLIVFRGDVYAWGNNNYGIGTGALGDGTTINRSVPVQITSSRDYSGVAAVWNTSSNIGTLILKNNGTLLATGQEGSGYIGGIYPFYTEGTTGGYALSTTARSSPVQIAGSTNIINSPIQIGTSSWSQVSAGFNHSMAIRSDRTLWGWGNNSQGQTLSTLGPTDLSSPTQVGSSSYISVSAGNNFSLAITNDYKLVSGGNNQFGQLGLGSNFSAAYSWSQIESGSSFTLAIRADGTLWGWGLNNLTGVLGQGDTINRSSPVQIGASRWSTVSAGISHVAGITIDGRLFAWGLNVTGELGDGTNISRSSPVQIGTNSWVAVAAGNSTTYMIDSNYKIWSVGVNSTAGQLGDNSTINRSTPIQITSFGSYTQISAGLSYGLALNSDGSIWAWGLNSSGQLGVGDLTNRLVPTRINRSSYTQIATGKLQATSFAIDINGFLYSWGSGTNNLTGQTDLSTSNISAPLLVGSQKWNRVFIGANNTNVFGIRTNGSLWAWGLKTAALTSDVNTTTFSISWTQVDTSGQHAVLLRNDYVLQTIGFGNNGQIGDNTTVSKSSPVQLTAMGSSFRSVAASYQNSFAINHLGILFAWGVNTSGELGTGDGIRRSNPTQVISTTLSWNQVSGGPNFTAGIALDGSLYRWGTTTYSLGGNTSAISWVQISAAQSHTALLRSDGALFTFGTNTNGQLGNNSLFPALSPIQIGNNSWTYVAAGAQSASGPYYTLAIRSDGTIWSWGGNSLFNLGDGTAIDRSSPVQVSISGSFTKVFGGDISYAIRNDGALFAWGFNYLGGMPVPTVEPRLTLPTLVSTNSWTQIAAGPAPNRHTAGIDNLGRLYTWGWGNTGQLGTWATPTFVSVASGISSTYVLDSTGVVYFAGTNENIRSKLLNLNLSTIAGVATVQNWPTVPVPLTQTSQYKISKIYPVSTNTNANSNYLGGLLMITDDGKLLVYGTPPSDNDATTIAQLASPQPDLFQDNNSWVSISATYSGLVALRSDNSMFVWGSNSNGELASNSILGIGQPQRVSLYTSFTQLGNYTYTSASAIDNLGRLFAWGLNNFGALGDNTTIARSSPVQILAGLSFVFSSSGATSFYITNEGFLYATGENTNGQIGDNSVVAKSSPVLISADRWSYVAQYPTGGCVFGIKQNGTLWAWGSNANGQLGDGTTVNKSSPVQIGTSSWITVGIASTNVSVNANVVFAIDSQNKLFAWGAGSQTIATAGAPQPIGGPRWQTLTAGGNQTLIIDESGRLYSFGNNNVGQLGLNDLTLRSSPVQIGTDSWTQVISGASHSMAIRSDGTLWGWGWNNNGQLGDYTTINRSSPILVSASQHVFLAASSGASAAITTDGNLFIWGRNVSGIIGDNTTVSRSSPIQLGAAEWKEVYLGGDGTFDTIYALKFDNSLWTWGNNSQGQLGNNSTVNRSSPVQLATNISRVVMAGQGTGAYLDNLNRLFIWGRGTEGQLGNNSTVNRSSPVQLGTSSYISIGSAFLNLYALTNDNILWGWGSNTNGQIGDNTTISRSTPVQVYVSSYTQLNTVRLFNNPNSLHHGTITGNTGYEGLFLNGLGAQGQLGETNSTVARSTPVQVGISSSRSSPVQLGSSTFNKLWYHANVIYLQHTDGSFWAVGRNNLGMYGIGDDLNRWTLTKIGNSAPAQVASGLSFAAYLTSTGKIFAAGTNSGQQFGLMSTAGSSASWIPVGTNAYQELKQLFPGSSFSMVASSLHHAAIRDNGTLWVWGVNYHGQLGLSDTVNRSSPVQVPGSWTSVAVGASYTVAIRNDFTLWSWGRNDFGQLGLNDVISRSSPVQIGTGSWIIVRAGADFALAVSLTNQLWSWGRNNAGQLGETNSTVSRSSPVQVGSASGSWTNVAVAGSSVMATTMDNNRLWVWGNNALGQLGLTDTVSRSSPTQIPGLNAPRYILPTTNNFQAANALLYIKDYNLFGMGQAGLISEAANRSSPVQLAAIAPQHAPEQITGSWTSVAVASQYTIATNTTGRLFNWGSQNSAGQLGLIGSDYYSISSFPNDINNAARQIGKVLYVRGDGTLWGVGYNVNGELGDNSTINRSLPVQIGALSDWKSVTAGLTHALAIKQDGSLWSWGVNTSGIVTGNPTEILTARSSPAQVGSSQWYTTNNVNTINIAQAGANVSFIVDSQNRLFAWGSNSNGSLGDNTTVDKSSPVLIMTGVSYIYANPMATTNFAIKTDGTLWSWGVNTNGELGDGTTVSRSSPVQIGIGSSWIQVTTGTDRATLLVTTYAIRSDYTMYAWGRGDEGLIGDGTSVSKSSPVQIGSTVATSWLAVYGGSYTAYALASNLRLYYWGNSTASSNTFNLFGGQTVNINSPTLWVNIRMRNLGNWVQHRLPNVWPRENNLLTAWGTNTTGNLGDNSTSNRSTPVQINVPGTVAYSPTIVTYNTASFTQVSAGLSAAYAIDTTNRLFAWGLNTGGQLGSTSTVSRSSPIQLGAGLSWLDLGGGQSHVVGIRSDNTVWSWGKNNFGQLGLGDTIDRLSPVQIPNLTTGIRVAKGPGNTTHMIFGSGVQNVYGFGFNGNGEIGDGTTINRSSPVLIGVAQSFTTIGFCQGVTLGGTLWSWGLNTSGQVGDNTTISRSVPTQIGILTTWLTVPPQTVGSSTRYALNQLGQLFGWGLNTSGQLGDNSTISRSSPVQISVGTSFTQVLAAGFTNYAISSTGLLFAWGLNNVGQLGLNDTVNRSAPTQITANTGSWSFLASTGTNGANGANSVIAIAKDRSVWAWGYNAQGQLGINDTVTRSSPVQVSTFVNNFNLVDGIVYPIAGGDTTTLGGSLIYFENTGLTYVWGRNNLGQLGQLDTVDRSSPVQLFGAPNSLPNSYVNVNSGGLAVYLSKPNSLFDSTGNNAAGLLGNNTTISRSAPTQVGTSLTTLTGIPNKVTNNSYTQISAGDFTATAVTTNGIAEAWGLDAFGTVVPGKMEYWTNVYGGSQTGAAITNLGSLYLWGINNNFGQIGNNATGAVLRLNKLDNNSWAQVSLNQAFVLAIKNDGTLWAWGQNTSGQLGDGTTINRSSPVQVGSLNNWIRVSALKATSLAINSNNKLFAWGFNEGGVVGDSTTISRSSPVQIGNNNWLALTKAGTGATGFLGGVDETAFAIDSQNRLFGWGINNIGLLGQGDTIARSSPVQIAVGYSFSQVASSGVQHMLALRTDGLLFAVGRNTEGQLGDGTTVSRSQPIQVGFKYFKNIAVGTSHSMAIDFNNNLFTWGLNTSGQLGDNSTISRSSPVQITVTPTSLWTAIGAADTGSIAIKNDGSLWTWGANSGPFFVAQTSSPVVLDGGFTTTVLGNTQSSPVQIGSFAIVSTGYRHALGIKTNGTLWGWGYNNEGQVGAVTSGSILSASGPAYIRNNDKTLWVWGDNTAGGVGDGTTISRSEPVQIAGSWLQVATGGGSNNTAGRPLHTLAIDSTYRLWGWGRNNFGILGNNVTISRSSPTQVGTLRYTKLSLGSISSMALKEDNTLVAWGNNQFGSLGDGTTVNKSIPSVVQTGLIIKDVVVGNGNVLILTMDGTLRTVGSDANGAQGLNTTNAHRSASIQIGTNNNWDKVADSLNCGTNNMGAAITTSGQLWVWGGNFSGSVGDNSTVSRSSPVQIGTTISWTMVTMGGYGNNSTTYGIDILGRLYAWGNNAFGQVGDNSTTNRSSPVQIGTSSWLMVSAGSGSVWAIDINNTLYAWGENTSGQLGLGNSVNRSVPTSLGTTALSVEAGSTDNTVSNRGFAFVLGTDNTLRVVGVNTTGALGTNDTVNRTTLTTVQTGVSYNSVSVGMNFSGGIRQNQSLFTFGGNNAQGQLGDNTIVNRSSPIQIASTAGMSWVFVSTSYDTNSVVFAIKEDNSAFVWGSNNAFGTLGLGDTIARSQPVQITGSWSIIRSNGGNSAGIRPDGTLFVWGANQNGQLGQNDTIDRSSPVQISGTYTDVTIASNTVSPQAAVIAFRKTDGTWWASGFGGQGGFGDSTTISRSSPIQIGTGKSYVSVYGIGGTSTGTAPSNKFNAIDNLGRLWGWGTNANGQLGDGTTVTRSSPVQITTFTSTGVPITGGSWVQINSNESGSFGVYRFNNTDYLMAWGTNLGGQIGQYSLVVGGDYSTPILVPSVKSYDSQPFYSSPVQLGIGYSWISIATGAFGSAAVRSDNLLFTWGQGNYGGLGNNDTISRSSPVQIPTYSFTSVSGGGYWIEADAFYAIRASAVNAEAGQLWGWGYGQLGQFGSNSTLLRSAPVQVTAGTMSTTNWLWPQQPTLNIGNSYTQVTVNNSAAITLGSNGLLNSQGFNSAGQLGINNVATLSVPQLIGNATLQTYVAGTNQVGNSSWSSVSAGYSHSLAIQTNNTIWGWGSKAGTGIDFNLTRYSWKQVIPGEQTFMGIRNDDTLWVVGNNSNGVLGLNDTVSRSTITQVPGSWRFVASTGFQNPVFGIRSDGTLWSWGTNTQGQLGQGDVLARSSPTQIGTNSWISVATGGTVATVGIAAYAIRSDYTVWVWGGNLNGQLGLGDGVARSSPVQLNSNRYTSVSAGWGHVLLIDELNYLWGIGRNAEGQLGLNDVANRTSPIQLGTVSPTAPTLLRVRAAAAGNQTSYYIRQDGTLWTVGNNQSGQLGLNDVVYRSSPVQIGTRNWKSITTAATSPTTAQYVLAIDVSNNLFTWGNNTNGQLGLGDTLSRSSPVQISTNVMITTLATSQGDSNSAFVDMYGQLFMAGSNTSFALGDGTTFNRSSPVQVTSGVRATDNSPTQITSGSWTEVNAGNETTIAVRTDGTLFGWGRNNIRQTNPASSDLFVTSPVTLGTNTRDTGNGATTAGQIKNI